MKTKNTLFLSLIVCIAFVLGCKKKEVNSPSINPAANAPVNTPITSGISDFFSENGCKPQSFTVNTTYIQTFYTTKGAIIHIYPNAFVTQSGQAVTGNVKFEITEVYTKKDMILTNAPTISIGELIESGGEVYLKATQNNQELKLSGNDKVNIELPTFQTNPPAMNEFYTTSLDKNNDWKPLNSAGNSVTVAPADSNNMGYVYTPSFYSFFTDSVNWVNCDFFPVNPLTNTEPKITIQSNINDTNVAIFLSLDNQKTVVNFYHLDGYAAHQWVTYRIPIGANAHIVAISKVNSQYYYCIAPVNITNNCTFTIPLIATTIDNIKTALTSLH